MQHSDVRLSRGPSSRFSFCLQVVLPVKPFRESLPGKLFKLSEVLIYKDLTSGGRWVTIISAGMCPVPENIKLLENIVAFLFSRACNALQMEKYILLQELSNKRNVIYSIFVTLCTTKA